MKFLAIQFIGFSSILVMNLLTAQSLKHMLFESVLIIPVASLTIWYSSRATKKLKHLQEFLRVCAWCKKVGRNGTWVSFEEHLRTHENMQTTHGICPKCSELIKEEFTKVS